MIDFETHEIEVNPNSVGDFETEWWTTEDWDNYTKLGLNRPHQESYIAEVIIAKNPLWDEDKSMITESHRMVIFDINDERKENDPKYIGLFTWPSKI